MRSLMRVNGAGTCAVGVLAVVLVIAACGGPLGPIPGGRLSGEVWSEPVSDWSFASEYRFLALETRPDDPYSVELNFFVRDGQLFVDPAEGRRWFDHLRADPNVRARLGDTVYRLHAVLVGRPGEVEGFDPERYVYRLDSRL